MALLYLNGSPIPYNVTEDMYLSPALTVPLEILEKFPPTYFLTGEKDPLVDDTVVFAARIRQAKEIAEKRNNTKKYAGNSPRRRNTSTTPSAELFDKVSGGGEHGVFVKILEGFSHGLILQYLTVSVLQHGCFSTGSETGDKTYE
jgi:hypothetical protein